ncbi:hypothetical protein IFR04_001550 [Cadophora malorum]|uniref:Uncharacterized protein n=1 Tax=Cadophora malorum TaxID=108018 RepID=A0A8H7WIA6_9HELO|nr:hypothetical protein IFR04_001550 [Cadophora malorum]
MTVEMICESDEGEGEGDGESESLHANANSDPDSNLFDGNASSNGGESQRDTEPQPQHQPQTKTSIIRSAPTSQTTAITVTFSATIFLAPSIDILVPRGFWNIVSFSDFCSRIEELEVQRIAIDVGGCFWKENLKDYCRRRCWVLNGVGEVFLYEGGGLVGLGKVSEHLERVREKEIKKRELGLVDLDLETDLDGDADSESIRKVKDVERFLGKVFDVLESEEDVEGDEDFGEVRKAQFVSMEQTEKSVFKRPAVRLVRLVTDGCADRV